MKKSIFLFTLIGFLSFSEVYARTLKIKINRKYISESCTLGEMIVDPEFGNYKFATLELPDNDNIKYLSSIPKGTYTAHGKIHIPQPGKKSLGWVIELHNVPGRTGVYIHVGVFPKNTTGCILIGTNWVAGNCMITDSGPSVEKLENIFTQIRDEIDFEGNSMDRFPVLVEVI